MKKIKIELTPRQAAIVFERLASDYEHGQIYVTDISSLEWHLESMQLLLRLMICLKIDDWKDRSIEELHQMILGEAA